jgi:MFS transporter, DHA2 family, methylenomycin A resistance protein
VSIATARKTSSRAVVLVVMCVGYFLVLLDVTVVNVALPSIGSDLGAGVGGLPGSSTAMRSRWRA